ncbi:MAG: decarboxylating 6-phosphogluconate dehydrogenase [Herpetosiphon sp.]|nr:decarboxylating 6-phosphogluconate dehydrogenase [Herpetosiphon sp.]
MHIGMIGLGKMGGNMTTRLLRGGHQVTVFDFNADAIKAAEAEGATTVAGVEELSTSLPSPHVIWMMIPAGKPVDDTIAKLLPTLQAGDILIDGGNSNYKDTQARAAMLAQHGIHFVDAGTSGGIWGLTEGYCMMVGAPSPDVFAQIEPIIKTLAPENGYGHVGVTGAGHFVKMVHNGIEYGMMQAYAEGFEIMQAKQEFNLDLAQIAEFWRYGSVVRSWLLDLTAKLLAENPTLDGIKGWVADSGEGRWTVKEAIDLDVPAPVITLSLLQRFVSRQDDSFAAKILAGMRNQFGGHAVKKD